LQLECQGAIHFKTEISTGNEKCNVHNCTEERTDLFSFQSVRQLLFSVLLQSERGQNLKISSPKLSHCVNSYYLFEANVVQHGIDI
jgi:hypothetical protein